MLDTLTQGYVTPKDVLIWLLIMVLFLVAINKIWPSVRDRAVKDVTAESLPAQIRKTNERIDVVEEKLDRDYTTINEIKKELNRQAKENVDSLEERQLLMSSMLAVLNGLQELGANGKTEQAREDLQSYINRKAHAKGTAQA